MQRALAFVSCFCILKQIKRLNIDGQVETSTQKAQIQNHVNIYSSKKCTFKKKKLSRHLWLFLCPLGRHPKKTTNLLEDISLWPFLRRVQGLENGILANRKTGLTGLIFYGQDRATPQKHPEKRRKNIPWSICEACQHLEIVLSGFAIVLYLHKDLRQIEQPCQPKSAKPNVNKVNHFTFIVYWPKTKRHSLQMFADWPKKKEPSDPQSPPVAGAPADAPSTSRTSALALRGFPSGSKPAVASQTVFMVNVSEGWDRSLEVQSFRCGDLGRSLLATDHHQEKYFMGDQEKNPKKKFISFPLVPQGVD